MGTIKNLADRFRALDFEVIKQESLRETAPDIIPVLNREQLKSGQFSDGTQILPLLENPRYALDKEVKNGLNGRSLMTPDFFNTGEFYESITTDITANTIKTFSLDLKAPKLELRSQNKAPYIYGLNPENLSKYAIQDLRPVLFAKLKEATVG